VRKVIKQRDDNPPTRHARQQGPLTGGRSAAAYAGAPVPPPAGLTNSRRARRDHFDDREPTFTPTLAQAAMDLSGADLLNSGDAPAA